MSRLLLAFLLFGPACLITGLSKRKHTEEVLAPACISVVLVLYLFYLFDQLLIGFYAVIGLLMGCWLLGLWFHLRKISKERIARFLSPGAIVFFLAMVMIWMVTKRSQTRHYDELRLWAGVPRALFVSNQLQLGSDCFTYPIMQSYYPGIALFQYFFQRLGSAFNENGLFFAYSILGLVMLLPCLHALKWKNGLWALPLSLVFVLLPATFANGLGDYNFYYYTIYIDPLLGIAFAYNLYTLCQLKQQQDRFEQITYILSLCMLILLKDSGLLLAVLSLILCLFLLPGKGKQKAGYLLVAAACMAATSGAWKILLSVYDVHNHISMSSRIKQFVATGAFTPQQSQTLLSFFRDHLLRENLTNTRFQGLWAEIPFKRSWLFFTLFFAGWSLLLWLAYRKHQTRVGGLLIGMHISNLVYQISLLVLYLFGMGSVLCYPRYCGTMMLAMMILLTLLTIQLLIAHPITQQQLAGLGLVGLVIVLSFTFELLSDIYTGSPDPVDTGIHHVGQIMEQLPERDPSDTVDVFVVEDRNADMDHHQIYFRSMDENVRIKSYYNESRPENNYPDGQAWLTALVENEYGYVYLKSFTPAFETFADELFTDMPPEKCRLYTVTAEGLVPAAPEITPREFAILDAQ